jgi:cytochrome P450
MRALHPQRVETTSIPLIAAMTHVDDYEDCKSILLRPLDFEVAAFHSVSEPVWGDIMANTNGRLHLARRREVGPLLARRAIDKLARVDALGETITLFLKALQEESPTSETSKFPVDAIVLSRLVTVQVAARIVGIEDAITTIADARRLLECVDGFAGAVGLRWITDATPEAQRTTMGRAQQAVEAYTRQFHEPAMRRAEVRCNTVGAGDFESIAGGTLVACQLTPAGRDVWSDVKRMAREGLALLMGGTQTTALALASVLDLYLGWAGRDRTREDDPDLLRGVVNETLRLRPPVPYVLRRAARDVTLPSGREIRAGQGVVLLVQTANRDGRLFGSDADEFQPERYKRLPSHEPHYGLTFGAGPHLCVGRPLVTTGSRHPRETSVQRVVMELFKRCLGADVERDLERRPTKADSYVDMFRTYPILLSECG